MYNKILEYKPTEITSTIIISIILCSIVGYISSINTFFSITTIIISAIIVIIMFKSSNILSIYFSTLSLFPILIGGQQISTIFLPLICIIFFAKLIMLKQSRLYSNNMLFISIFYIINIFYISTSSNIGYAIQNIFKLTACILLYIITLNLHIITKENNVNIIKKIIKLVIVTGAIISLILIYKYKFIYKVKYVGINLMYETEAGKNQLAFFLATILPFSILSIEKNDRKSFNIILKISSVILIVAAILTDSRGVIISLLVASLLTYLITKKNINNITKIIIIITCIFISLLYILPLFNSEFYIGNMGSNEIRIELIRSSINTFIENLGIGIGLGNFYEIPRNLGMNVSVSHNDYLQIMVELGFIGIVIFILILYKFLKNLIRIKLNLNKSDINLYNALICSNISIMVYLLFINSYNILLVWFIFGLSMNFYNIYKKQIK